MPGQAGGMIGWDRVGWDEMNDGESQGTGLSLGLRGVCTVQRGALDAAAGVSRAGGCGRLLPRAGLRAKAEDKDPCVLPEMGSEVLGTERGTRPHTGALSIASSSSSDGGGAEKGEIGGGRGPGRGRSAPASISGSA